MEFDIHKNLGPLVGITAKGMRRQMNRRFAEGGYDVTAEQMLILMHLWHREGSSQQVLADICTKDKTSTTRMIDTMEKNGLLKRVPNPKDRRQNMIYLTEQGRSKHDELLGVVIATHTQAQEGIDDERLKICKEVLIQVITNLIKQDPNWPGPKFDTITVDDNRD